MKSPKRRLNDVKNQNGAVAVLTGILLVVLLSFSALAIDIGHLMVVRNQLQNAADAGALRGAQVLFSVDGTTINASANLAAKTAAMDNYSANEKVEVNYTSGNTGDVQRGHWSFATKIFTPNDRLIPILLNGKTAAQLDADLDFVNAVRVQVRRENNPAKTYLAGIFGVDKVALTAEAIAYVGFPGTLQPGDIDLPFAICQEAICTPGGGYSCNVARTINSGTGNDISNNGGWTSLSQESKTRGEQYATDSGDCGGNTVKNEVEPYLKFGDSSSMCGDPGQELVGNDKVIVAGRYMSLNGGDIAALRPDLLALWECATGKNKAWPVALPVVECTPDPNDCGVDMHNPPGCAKVVGAVQVVILWITDDGTIQPTDDAKFPSEMRWSGLESERPSGFTDWPATDITGMTNVEKWDNFVDHFNIKLPRDISGNLTQPVPTQKTMYFLPLCTEVENKGITGGENFGILAKVPKLVE